MSARSPYLSSAAIYGLVALALTVVSACGQEGRSATDFQTAPTGAPLGSTTPTSPESTARSDTTEAKGAPEFVIQTVAGQRFSLGEQRGKVVGVLFMASWCATCVPEAQAWARLQREYGERGLEVLMVSADPADTPEELGHFKKLAQGPERHWAIDRDGKALVLPYQVRTLDTTLIFDRQGRLAYRDEVPTPYARLKAEVEKLL